MNADAVELSSAVTDSGLVMAWAVVGDEGWVLRLGTWAIRDDKPVPPKRPLLLEPDHLYAATAMALEAAETVSALPLAFDETGKAELGKRGELELTAWRTPQGQELANLAWCDGSGVCYLPVSALGDLARVLVEASDALGKLVLSNAQPMPLN